jgi:hypothetical protein
VFTLQYGVRAENKSVSAISSVSLPIFMLTGPEDTSQLASTGVVTANTLSQEFLQSISVITDFTGSGDM